MCNESVIDAPQYERLQRPKPMKRRRRPNTRLYILLFLLAMAMAYLAGMHVERGRQKFRRVNGINYAAPPPDWPDSQYRSVYYGR